MKTLSILRRDTPVRDLTLAEYFYERLLPIVSASIYGAGITSWESHTNRLWAIKDEIRACLTYESDTRFGREEGWDLKFSDNSGRRIFTHDSGGTLTGKPEVDAPVLVSVILKGLKS